MKQIKNILFVTSPKEDNAISFQRAANLAAHNQAKLTIMGVLEHTSALVKYHSTRESAARILAKATRSYFTELDQLAEKAAPQVEATVKIVDGTPILEIIRSVIRDGHDLVIKVPHPQHGFKEMLFGSTDMHLLRKCPCPIWMIKAGTLPPYRKIAAAVDLESSDDNRQRDDLNSQILEMASSLALSEPGELHIINAWQASGERLMQTHLDLDKHELYTWMEAQKKAFQTELDCFMKTLPKIIGEKGAAYIAPQLHLIQGSPDSIIPETVREKQIDLIVMGTVARTGLEGFFMGNTAESILNQISCSVLALKPTGFRTPVTL